MSEREYINEEFALRETLRARLALAAREDEEGSFAAGIINRLHYGEPEPLIDMIVDTLKEAGWEKHE